jgi:hypothetical protein
MTNRPKQIGTAAETNVVAYARALFPDARRQALAGVLDIGDVELTPGLIVEVKAGAAAKHASAKQVTEWIGETERERGNAKAHTAILVRQRNGYGATRVGMWWAHVRFGDIADLPKHMRDCCDIWLQMPLADALHVLHRHGWGDE